MSWIPPDVWINQYWVIYYITAGHEFVVAKEVSYHNKLNNFTL